MSRLSCLSGLHIIALCLLLAGAICAQNEGSDYSNDPQYKWELSLGLLSIEQPEGLILKGTPGTTIPSSIQVSRVISDQLLMRASGRRIDWNVQASVDNIVENSTVKGFGISAGVEKRWNPDAKVKLIAGGDLLVEYGEITGELIDLRADPAEREIDHDRIFVGLSPFAGVIVDLSQRLYCKVETAFNLGVTKTRNYTGVQLEPSDVNGSATIRPVGFLGLGYRL